LDQGPTETETRNRNLGRRTLAQGSSDDIHAELRRRGVTLALLWKECRGHHPDGYGYGRFCDLYVEWRHGITATMRQVHAAGEKLFVDFGGDTVPLPLKLEDCQELFNRRPPDRRLNLVGQYAMRLRQMDLAYGRHVGFVEFCAQALAPPTPTGRISARIHK